MSIVKLPRKGTVHTTPIQRREYRLMKEMVAEAQRKLYVVAESLDGHHDTEAEAALVETERVLRGLRIMVRIRLRAKTQS